MPLHQRIGRIFHANGDTNARRTFSDSLKRFLVDDIGTDRDELRVVLLVESPHTHEVGYCYPLAGETGRHVRDIINREEIKRRGYRSIASVLPDGPIGRFVRDGHLGRPIHDSNHPGFLRLGVMNVSRLPFQGKAYDSVPWADGDCRGHDGWNDYIKCMEYIKKYPGDQNPRKLSYEITRLKGAIIEDLRIRLDCPSVNNPYVLLVCCGPVAKEFYTKAIGEMPVCSIRLSPCNLPHPAHNQWNTLDCQETSDCQNECLRNILNRIWPSRTGA